jgi:hypothetical protein
MLKFAAVGARGRELPFGQAMCGLMLVFQVTRLAAAQPLSPSAFDDLLPELVAKVASALPAGGDVIVTVALSDDNVDDAPGIRTRAVALFTARGLHVAETGAEGITVVIGCGRNVRERACVAEFLRDGRAQIATVTGGIAPSTAIPSGSVALALRPLLSQRTQILDAAFVGERMLLLDTAAVTLFERQDGDWHPVQSRPLPTSLHWPRDRRGLVRVNGNRFDLFLPALTCHGRADSLEFACTDGQQPWPIGGDNKGLDPGRNYFKTPDGAVFYNAAPLGAGANDDAIALLATCAPGTYVASVSTGEDMGRDLLRLAHVVDGRLLEAAPPVVLPGVLTALWPQPDRMSAVAVTQDVVSRRYDAFQATVSCSR